MAEQTFRSTLLIPELGIIQGYSSNVIDAANEKSGGILQIPFTGTLSKIGWRTGTVTTGATVDVRVETVDPATGLPSGTLFGTNSNADQVVDAADDNTWFVTTLTTGPSVTKGDMIAIVIANPGASFGDMQISCIQGEGGITYGLLFTTSWAKTVNRGPVNYLEYSDGSIHSMPMFIAPFTNFVSLTFNNNSTPDEIGIIFQFPFPFRVTGFWARVDVDSLVDVKLYDSDGSTVLQSFTLDPDIRRANTVIDYRMFFSGESSLKADTNYRITVTPTGSMRFQEYTLDKATAMDALMGGQNVHKTERTDGGSWTETTTKRPRIGLMVDGFDDGGAAPFKKLTSPAVMPQ